MSDTVSLQEWIRERRTARGLNPKELAAAVGVSSTRAAKWEAGEKEPTLCEAARLFRALGVADGDVLKLLSDLCGP